MKKNSTIKKIILSLAIVLMSYAATVAQCVVVVTSDHPFVEGFDNELECWTVESNGGNWTTVAGSASTVAAFSFNEVGDEARLISPTLDLSAAASATFSFSYAMIGIYTYDELVVSYRSSETDSWHELQTYNTGDPQNFFEDSFDLSDLSATYQISFLGRGLGGYMIFVDNVEVVAEGGCARPVNLEATDIRATSALLNWSVGGNEEGWTLNFDGHTFDVDTQPYLMEHLDPQTDYTFTVKAKCGDGLESDWAVPVSFSTLCDVITVTDEEPFFDDFEASEDFVCWQRRIVSGIDNWVVDPGYTILNNTAFFIWLGGEAVLISPTLDITAVTNPTLTFKHKQLLGLSYGTVDELYVGYRTDESEIFYVLEHFTNPTDNWETVSIPLPNPSATYQIVFEGIGHDAEGIYVDDVEVANVENDGVTEATEIKILDGEVTVFDLFGRMVATAQLRAGQLDLDMSTLSQGVYIARIKSDKGFSTMKIVKD